MQFKENLFSGKKSKFKSYIYTAIKSDVIKLFELSLNSISRASKIIKKFSNARASQIFFLLR